MKIPPCVKRFSDTLLASTIERIDLDFGKQRISGHRGIMTTSHIQYNCSACNMLGREMEYTFRVAPERDVEVSLQLYLNYRGHWRLFSYCRDGMLLSINLTLLRNDGAQFTLYQTMRIAVQNLTQEDRAKRTSELCRVLRNIGMEIDGNNRLILGTFDSASGRFLDTSPKFFLRSFITAALIKGHFMSNKGYSLRSLPRQPQAREQNNGGFKGRSIPLGLRYQVLERAGFKCRACGYGISDRVKLHVDHITPVSQGGLTTITNLQVLCSECNLGKGNRSARRIA